MAISTMRIEHTMSTEVCRTAIKSPQRQSVEKKVSGASQESEKTRRSLRAVERVSTTAGSIQKRKIQLACRFRGISKQKRMPTMTQNARINGMESASADKGETFAW